MKKGLAIILCCLAVVLCLTVYIDYQIRHTSTARPENQSTAEGAPLVSSVDKDADGIDDQTDILNSALAYIRTEPKYQSKYYATGYPDDGYGVCTDVVANALKGAGYDLQQLLKDDIASNGADYNIEVPDANIDFRRVPNLNVYFSHTAISLTTDISDTKAWQGGDIVVFQNHIGIVSDRRNKNGVPFVIHHNGTRQWRYEEDILERRKDLVAHYRISE